MKKLLVPLLILALLCVSLPALADGNTMAFAKEPNTLFEGETLQTVLNREGAPAEGELSYSSSNTKVATVDDHGLVTGLSKGKATITASAKTASKTYRAQINITVARKATDVTVNTSKLPLYAPDDPVLEGLLKARENEEENQLSVLILPVKKSYSLAITVLPKDASNLKTVLTTDNEDVLKVRGNNITGQQVGEALLTIANEASPEVSVQYRVLVVQPIKSLKPSASTAQVAVGEQITLDCAVQPDDATMPRYAWSSGTEKLASVDEKGVVTGLTRGNARIVVTALDGSNVRANLNVKVVQKAESITLDKTDVTVSVGGSAQLIKATVLPANTDDKSLVWETSDPSIATVNAQGRVTAVSVGECVVTCSSKATPGVTATATIHAQQPVKSITFGPAVEVYLGDTAKVTWTVEPANASNPGVTLSSSNTNIVTVASDGTLTPVKAGSTYINAVSVDGSNRRARVQVKVLQHVTGVHMYRNTAYVARRETASTRAVLEPSDASNNHMTWESADESIATVTGNTNQCRISGIEYGSTTVTGTTEDGGFKTSIRVKIGDWNRALKLRSTDYSQDDDHRFWIDVQNVNDELEITQITAEITFFEHTGDEPHEASVNTKDGSNKITAVWNGRLSPGQSTGKKLWTMYNYAPPMHIGMYEGTVTITEFVIDHDWVKVIPTSMRPAKDWNKY